MSRDEFLRGVDEILELPAGTLKGPENLDDYPLWDSTAVISFLALADSHDGRRLSPREIAGCQTVSDLLNLVHIET